MALMTCLSAIGAVILVLLSPWLVVNKLKIPIELQAETLNTLYLLSASIPVVVLTTGLRGILEAHKRFDITNIVRAPLGMITYLGPLVVLPFSNTLPAMVAILIAARVIAFMAYTFMCLRLYPDLARQPPYMPELFYRLISFGGWMTLSNIAAPLLLYLGRLTIAVMISVEAVAYFSVPYDIVIKLLTIPSIFVTVLFPIFAEQFPQNSRLVKEHYIRSMYYLLLVMLPLTMLMYFTAELVLDRWINSEFSENSHHVAQLLIIGVFINSFGHISQSLIQAYGRADITAKLHIIELMVYVPYLVLLVKAYGIEGAAAAWVIRVTISTIVLSTIANNCLAGIIKMKD